MPKYAIILNCTEDTTEFRSSFGFYNKQIKDLEKAGYEILKIDVKSASCIAQLKNLSDDSVGFLWFRMHGSDDSMTASQTFVIDLNNVTEIFDFLPTIMHPNGILFLDSCLTGSLKNRCNNMQFAFAKLTLQKPKVHIAAPSESIHISYFSISEDGNFSFEMLEKNYSTNNVTIVLGEETKAILSRAKASDVQFESVQDELITSLQKKDTCPFLGNFRENFGKNFDLTTQLINVINDNDMEPSNIILDKVKEFIEVYHANPDHPEGFILFAHSWKHASPLFSAVYYKLTNVALYLLEHGANPFYTVRKISVLDYAKQRDEDTAKINRLDADCIADRREKENDNSKMFDSMQTFLNSRQQTKDSQSLLQFSFLNTFGSLTISSLDDRDKKSMACVNKTCYGFFTRLSEKATEVKPMLNIVETHRPSS